MNYKRIITVIAFCVLVIGTVKAQVNYKEYDFVSLLGRICLYEKDDIKSDTV